MRHIPRLALAAAGLLALLAGAWGQQNGPLELLANGGFESVQDGLPVGWEVGNAGKPSSVPEPHSGRLAAQFAFVPHEWGYCAVSARVPRIAAGGTYRLSLWAKGQGEVRLAVYQYSAAGFIGTSFLKPSLKLTDQWQKIEAVYEARDARVRGAAFAMHLYGQGAAAILDDASFTFDPAENPGLTIELDRPQTTTLHLQVKARDAKAALLVNGQETQIVDGAATTEITEGLVCVAVTAEATGDRPGVSVRIADHAEADGRWRVGTAVSEGWTQAEFNDTAWPVGAPDAEGCVWAAGDGAKTALLRQVLLWNATHYGPNRCLVPPVKVWEFPRGGFDTLHLALYSPLPHPLTDYEFVLDVPEEFVLLDKTNYQPRYILNDRPEKIVAEKLTRDGAAYRRYRLCHKASEVTPDQTHYSLLPLKLSGKPKRETCRFFLRRQARGNFTELEQTLPVKVLPPVNGRMPKRILISQYSPVGYSTSSKEHLQERLRADAAAGCNTYMIGWNYGWGDMWREYLKLFHDSVAGVGAHLVLWMNYPLNYGGLDEGHLAVYPDWIKVHPEAHGRYYNDTPAWDPAQRHAPYCNQYVLTPEGAEFWEVVKREYTRGLDFLPKTEFFFNDWEFHNLNKDGTGVHCFCDRCKQAFRAFAKLPPDADLSDEAIVRDHREQWIAFRDWQDGQLQGRIAAVARDLGRRYVPYSWSSNMGFWAACRGQIEEAFVGCPGNSVADSYYQKMLDDYIAEFREKTGLKRALGQRFVFFKDVKRDGWQAMVLSHDGFVHPRSWKSQVLRVAASVRGGVDLQNSDEFCGGIRYYLGEATRIIADFEPLFWDGERADDLAASKQIAYPNLLVLLRGDERLVLLFNEGAKPLAVTLANKGLRPGHVARVYGSAQKVADAGRMAVTVPPEDAAVIHIAAPRP